MGKSSDLEAVILLGGDSNMSELDILISTLKSNNSFTYSEFYDIYPFPTDKNYCEKVKDSIDGVQYDKRGRKMLNNNEGTGVYNKIQELEPKINVNINNNGVYIFEDENGRILYIGKSTRTDDRIFNRVLNHCVPNFDGQQNTIEI